eukprot:jgi/Botrbrau1/16986/Bobra.49_2s0045.1
MPPYPPYGQYPPYYYEPYAAPPTYFSIDVECVATGLTHNARAAAQVAVVDEYEQVLLNRIVKPAEPVVSYLTPLTGLTEELMESDGVPLQQVVQEVKQILPQHAVLVGLNIQQDVQWLGLREGVDFKGLLDLTGLYQAQHPNYRTPTRFGLAHLSKVLLQSPTGEQHDAADDAWKSIRLWNLYRQLQDDPSGLQRAKDNLLNTPVDPSFAKLNPTCDGVCMGNKKTCKCGAPLFLS